jgi:polysaccharide deacetylase family protein (PEP-CTERM system associated)
VARAIASFTLDVEDWHHPELLRGRLGADARRTSVVERGTHRVLEMLARHDARATFFVLGEVALEHPALVRAIAAGGHEIACHGMTHKPLWSLDRASLRAELRAYRDAIRMALGHDPSVGFRAPTFSLDRSTAWALEVLADEGFTYDSSIFPRRVRMYGVDDAPLGVWRPAAHDLAAHDPAGRIVEFPVAVASVAGVRVPVAGGFYLRALPEALLTAALDRIGRQRPFVLYLHPWECVPDAPRVPLPPADALITWFNLRSVPGKLERLLGRYAIQPMREILEQSGHLAPAAAARRASP